MNSNLDAKLLVTGASGQMGKRTVEILLEKGAENVIAVTRSPEKIADFAQKGVEIRKGDFDDEASLDEAFKNVDILLLISTDAIDRPGRRGEQHLRAISAAKKAGVKHILYTSFTSPDDSPVAIAPDHKMSEEAIRETGIPYTILRNNLYMEMLPQTISQAIESGKLYSAAGRGAAAYVAREDCAWAAAGAMLAAGSDSAVLDVTGPESLTQGQLAELATELTGTPVEYVPLTEEAGIAGMVGAGLSEQMAKVFITFDLAIASGKHDVVTPVVREVGGKEPISFREFLKTALEG